VHGQRTALFRFSVNKYILNYLEAVEAMRIIILTNYRKKLLYMTAIILLWLLLFNLGSIIIENEMLLRITVGSSFEFSYPHSIIVRNVFVKNDVTDQSVVYSFLPLYTRTDQFLKYKSIDGNISFDYPSAFVISEKTFSGGEILYHIDFHDNQNVVHGFVQVWTLSEDLGTFLKKSTDSSQNNYKYFITKPIEINDLKGYSWDYSVAVDDHYYKGMEIFLSKEGRMYRMSYFLPEDKWDEKQLRQFWKMVKSMKVI
jgi:hypothetical protein